MLCDCHSNGFSFKRAINALVITFMLRCIKGIEPMLWSSSRCEFKKGQDKENEEVTWTQNHMHQLDGFYWDTVFIKRENIIEKWEELLYCKWKAAGYTLRVSLCVKVWHYTLTLYNGDIWLVVCISASTFIKIRHLQWEGCFQCWQRYIAPFHVAGMPIALHSGL